MTHLRLGEPAPDFALTTVEGEAITLHDVLADGRSAVLVFLRHLGCLPCRAHVTELCDRRAELAALNASVLIVSFGTLPAVQRWLAETCGEFRVGIDRDRSVYTAYGLERSFWRSRSLRTRWFYFRAWLAATPTHTSQGEDLSQLGGDFIVDPSGRLRLVHPSREPVDRPSVDQIFDVLISIKAGP